MEETGENVLELLQNKENYPVNLRFGLQKLTSNDKIIMASTFHTVFAFACQVGTQSTVVLVLVSVSGTLNDFRFSCHLYHIARGYQWWKPIHLNSFVFNQLPARNSCVKLILK